MDQFSAMSDDELRRKLLEYGFPNLPVTSTTRKVLVKKLRNHVKAEQAKLKQATSFATRYSSDEETSDRSDRETNRQCRTTTLPIKQRLCTKRFTSQQSPTKISPRTSSVFVPPLMRHQQNNGNDDETDHETNNLNSSFSSYGSSLSRTYSQTMRPSSSNLLPSSTFLSSYNSSNHVGTSQLREQPVVTSNGHNDDLFSNDNSQRFSNYKRSPRPSSQSPTHRLSHKGMTPWSRQRRNDSFSTLNECEIVHQAESYEPTQIPIGTALSQFIKKLKEQFSVKQTFVPWIILGCFTAFFALVICMYISISPDLASTMNAKETLYNLCTFNNEYNDRSVSCIQNEDLNSTLDLLKITASELQKRMELNKCKDSSIPFTMSVKDVINNAMRKSSEHSLINLIKYVNNMEYLIKMNPQWSLSNCDSNGYSLSFDDVIDLRRTQSNYFVIQKVRLPFMCSLKNKMGKFFTIIGWFTIIFSIVYGICYIYRRISKAIQSNQDKKNSLITEIIIALMEKAEEDPTNPEVVVNHLRDKLLSSSSRSNLEWVWDEAINYLENNDSRIKFEIGCRNGEDCRLMKWIDTAASSGGNRAFAKKWQGPAYDKINKIKDPPAQCLKIRQMFEKHEVNNPNLKQIIQDALLEKVGSNSKIHDIQLDLDTCCVYVRCASVVDAGMVHDLVNGWWFDGRLVSMKFLRLERYLSRFPQSTGVAILQPSNTKNLSMSYYVEESGRVRPQGSDDD